MLVLLALILLPIVAISALLIVDDRRIALKRVLLLLAILSPTPAAWVLSSYNTRFHQSECYVDVATHIQYLTLEYTKVHGDKAALEVEKALEPYMRGYETDCKEVLMAVRNLRAPFLPPGAEVP